MSLVGKAPGTVFVTISADFSRLRAGRRQVQATFRKMGMADRQRRREWRNLSDSLSAWENEGGALE